jgi:transketolase
MTQRDAFISELFKLAKKDKDIILISADIGAPSLDVWRKELPDQFLFTGISEQNTINVAAGLSASGKKVYLYFMAVFTARCFEQIRYSCALPENPVTILSNSVGLGYAPSGPAHNPTDDIAYVRSLLGIEIYSLRNTSMVRDLVKKTYEEPKLRYVRLERKYDTRFDDIEYDYNLDDGIMEVKSGSKIALISCGYMLGRCLDVWQKMLDNKYEVALYDMYRLKPNPITEKTFKQYDKLVSVEEQTLSGGVGSIILEGISDCKMNIPLLRLGLPDRYIFENGSRDYHLDNNGLSVDSIYENIIGFVNED